MGFPVRYFYKVISKMSNMNWIDADEDLETKVKKSVRSSIVTTWGIVGVFAVIGIICYYIKGIGTTLSPSVGIVGIVVLLLIGFAGSINDIRFLTGKIKYAQGNVQKFTREATRRNPFYGVQIVFDNGEVIENVTCTIELSKKIVNENERVIVVMGQGRNPYIFEVKE